MEVFNDQLSQIGFALQQTQVCVGSAL